MAKFIKLWLSLCMYTVDARNCACVYYFSRRIAWLLPSPSTWTPWFGISMLDIYSKTDKKTHNWNGLSFGTFLTDDIHEWTIQTFPGLWLTSVLRPIKGMLVSHIATRWASSLLKAHISPDRLGFFGSGSPWSPDIYRTTVTKTNVTHFYFILI